MKKYTSIVLAGMLFMTAANATEQVSPKATQNVPSVNKDIEQLMNKAGRQRMLSQRIIKNYLYIGMKVAKSKATKEMNSANKEFIESLGSLKIALQNNPEALNLIEFTELSIDDLKELLKEDYNTENAQLALDLSETLLEGSQYIVNLLDKGSNAKAISIVDISGKQRMLSQRIAKYYIAYQIGIKDKNTIDQMNSSVESFQNGLTKLLNNPSNTPEINIKLDKVNKLWKIVNKFYLNIEKGGLPIIVYNTTNKITKEMNVITKLYEDVK